MCRAQTREQQLPNLVHDTSYHASLLEQRHDQKARCVVTGLSLHALCKIGEKLSVDRIDPTIGYIPGNCQLMANCLNNAKGLDSRVPQYAINRLLRRMSRVVEGFHCAVPLR